MKPPCPWCTKPGYSYRALLSVHPYRGEVSPASITCANCGEDSRITATSRLLAIVFAVATALGPLLLLAMAGADLPVWQIALVPIVGLAFYYFVIWPVVLRLKP